MLDRIAPAVVLLLNRALIGFVFLFGLVASLNGPRLPRIWVYLLAISIWAIPDLVNIARACKSAERVRRVYSAVLLSIRTGYLALAAVFLAAAIIRYIFPGLPWALVGFVATFVVVTAEGFQLRRQFRHLSMLGQ